MRQLVSRVFWSGLTISVMVPAAATTPHPDDRYSDAIEYYRDEDYRRAANYLQDACHGSHFESCAVLGTLYWTGDGVSPDRTRAIEQYETACHGGIAAACEAQAADTWYRPQEFPMTPEHRLELAKTHHKKAQLLSTRSDDQAVLLGTTTPPGGAERAALLSLAAALLEDACSSESMEGCAALAGLYRQGFGVPVDPTRAAALSQQACDGGYTAACEATPTPEPEPEP